MMTKISFSVAAYMHQISELGIPSHMQKIMALYCSPASLPAELVFNMLKCNRLLKLVFVTLDISFMNNVMCNIKYNISKNFNPRICATPQDSIFHIPKIIVRS
jgi:hypothetical protein